MSAISDNIVQLKGLRFCWPKSAEPILAIEDFHLKRGERLFLSGPSGSGKTTLLSIIAAVLKPDSGEVWVDKTNLASLKSGQNDQFRVDKIGLIFQQFNLLPFLSVAENIQLPCRFSKQRKAKVLAQGRTIQQETERLLEAMKLPGNMLRNRTVSQLSVGQQQRVAVARALIGQPPLIIADEPTSALDSDTRLAFLELLFSECERFGCSLLYVSHDSTLADSFDRRLSLCTINQFKAPEETGVYQT